MDPEMTAIGVDLAALDDLILGRGVKRGRHDLPPEAVPYFLERLAALGFVESSVRGVEIEVGVRVPAWLLRGEQADFGMIFWEVFTDAKKRKLFASEVRNERGDWAVMLPAGAPQKVHAAPALAESYDPSRPVGMF
jgi:hypothetical protein